ncbi:type IV secretory system conjugative DNA transfer family protein [Stenotrophomonas maltophilia]|uniref:type IV secretory system conjugative DNA transfer family protein n=1 Tax=Stenotrophomonas maltophilia TaxID=40324 RepID=UPI003D7ED62E
MTLRVQHRGLRVLAVVACACLALLLGTYLAGYVALELLGLRGARVSLRTYWILSQSLTGLPELAARAGTVRAAGVLGYGVPVASAVLLAYLALRQRDPAVHGDARFASRADLRRSGLLNDAPNGIVLGRQGDQLLKLGGQQFVILAAPTRSGKGVGVVIPNLLEYADSMVVLDIKQENYNLTSGWRKAQGQEVFLFNPMAEDGRTHRWNPLRYISDNPMQRPADLFAVAAMLYPDKTGGEGDSQFWVAQARNAFLALTLYMFEYRDDATRYGHSLPVPSLGDLLRLATGTGDSLLGTMKDLASRPFLGSTARMAFGGLTSHTEKTFASVMSSLREPLNPWLNPVTCAATDDDDFLLTDLRKRRITIYIGITPNKLAECAGIINLFFSQVINQNTRTLPQDDDSLKHQCLLLMDEFTAIGKVDIIAKAVSYMAGYNLRLLPIIQSMAQLEATYGPQVSRTLVTNHAVQIIYAPREQKDAQDYSELLGYRTQRRWNLSRAQQASSSEALERRALMLPQEVKALGPARALLLYEGAPGPIRCEKIMYYKEKRFTRRLLPAVEVPALDLGAYTEAMATGAPSSS